MNSSEIELSPINERQVTSHWFETRDKMEKLIRSRCGSFRAACSMREVARWHGDAVARCALTRSAFFGGVYFARDSCVRSYDGIYTRWQVKDALDEMYGHHLQGNVMGQASGGGEDGDKEEDYGAYVCNPFSIVK